MRKPSLYLSTFLIALTLFVCASEWLVRVLAPQAFLYPRYRHSDQYGLALPPSAHLVHALPGHWRFEYTVDEYGHRAPALPVSNRYQRPNVVLLGDSNTFGIGVNDGEEYAAVLRRRLDHRAGIANLGVPGYGIAQQIRRFYEFGRLYDPAVVVLQFCGNDPEDTALYAVTRIENGQFRFVQDRFITGRWAGLKSYLSGSRIQQSQLYNFLRNRAFPLFKTYVGGHPSTPSRRDSHDRLYNTLLDAFARDLAHRRITLLFFDVPGHLAQHPTIEATVVRLHAARQLRYLRSDGWFAGVEGYSSPEGHPWGTRGHAGVARHLATELQDLLTHYTGVRK